MADNIDIDEVLIFLGAHVIEELTPNDRSAEVFTHFFHSFFFEYQMIK